MGNHTASAEGGAYTARARMRSAGRQAAATTHHPLETPIVRAPTSSAVSDARSQEANARAALQDAVLARRAGQARGAPSDELGRLMANEAHARTSWQDAQQRLDDALGGKPGATGRASSTKSASPREPGAAASPKTPRNTVASSAALAFHRANRPVGSSLQTVGPGLYRLSMPGMAPRVVTGQDLNAAFRQASRANRQGMRTQARGLAQSLRPTKAHGGKGEHGAHGNILHDALHLYHRTLHTLGQVMG